MRKSRFSEEQIAYALRQVESGTPATALCRKLRISEETLPPLESVSTPGWGWRSSAG